LRDRVSMVGVPPKPSHFSINEWYLNSREKLRIAEDQHQLADRIITESERLIDETNDVSLKNRKEVDHQLQVKISDIEFKKSQLEYQKKEMDLEVEALVTYKQRVIDAQNALNVNALEICRKCLMLREKRTGIDLCIDDVELELLKEIQVIEGAQAMLVRVLEQVNEQIRRLRAMTYTLIRDLESKDNVLVIDKHNLTLKETSLNLSIYHGSAPLDPATITQEEWATSTQENIDAAAKELTTGRPLRAYIDVLLKQVVEDLWKQYDIVNEAFRRRIEEYKDYKAKLENQHFETVRQANEMNMMITKLEKAIAEKEGFMALAHTRLGNRCQRSGVELCRDEAETYLVDEVRQIKEVVTNLQQMMAERLGKVIGNYPLVSDQEIAGTSLVEVSFEDSSST